MYDISAQYEKFDWGHGENYRADHFCILSSHQDLRTHYDILVFTDSRGLGKEKKTDQAWIEKLATFFDLNTQSYLIISRPKTLTVVFSLISFLEKQTIKFQYLLTNLGFVDFTPKKQDFIEDIVSQSPPHWQILLQSQYLCHYSLQEGNSPLFSLNYGDLSKKIASFLENIFAYTLLLGTLEFSQNIKIERQRPQAFFDQIRKTNQFLFETAQYSEKIHYLQPLKFPIEKKQNLFSFDAVHFTQKGHDTFFELIKPFIQLYCS